MSYESVGKTKNNKNKHRCSLQK